MNKINYDAIDEEMRPLIRAMNDAGLRTISCCAGHDDARRAAISFSNILSMDIVPGKGICIRWDPDK